MNRATVVLRKNKLSAEAASLIRKVPKEKLPEAVNFLNFLFANNSKTTP